MFGKKMVNNVTVDRKDVLNIFQIEYKISVEKSISKHSFRMC